VDVGSPEIRRALQLSFWDGIFAQAMVALCETFAVAAGVRLRATPLEISLLAALPLLLGAILQYLLPALLTPGQGRKPLVLWGVRLQSAFLFLAAAAGWLPDKWGALLFVAAFAMAGVSGNATQGLWTAWFGDLLPKSRGRHLAWRNQYIALSYLGCSLLAGFLCRSYHTGNAPWMLFALVFWVASLFRLLSYACMTRQLEPTPKTREAPFTLRFRPDKAFLGFCLGTAFFQGAATFSGPFFNVWYLRDLRFDYLQLALTASCTVLGALVFSRPWGIWLDRHGAAAVMRMSGALVCLVPLPYLVLSHPLAVFTINFLAGGAWAGYTLGQFHFLLTSVQPARRNQSIAFFSLCLGLIGFGLSLLGGFLAPRLPVLLDWRLQTLFLASFLMRSTVYLAFFPGLRDLEAPSALPPWEALNLKSGFHRLRLAFRSFRNE
jgi:MFS family permease